MTVSFHQVDGHWFVNVDGRVLTVAQVQVLRNRLNAVLSQIEKAQR